MVKRYALAALILAAQLPLSGMFSRGAANLGRIVQRSAVMPRTGTIPAARGSMPNTFTQGPRWQSTGSRFGQGATGGQGAGSRTGWQKWSSYGRQQWNRFRDKAKQGQFGGWGPGALSGVAFGIQELLSNDDKDKLNKYLLSRFSEEEKEDAATTLALNKLATDPDYFFRNEQGSKLLVELMKTKPEIVPQVEEILLSKIQSDPVILLHWNIDSTILISSEIKKVDPTFEDRLVNFLSPYLESAEGKFHLASVLSDTDRYFGDKLTQLVTILPSLAPVIIKPEIAPRTFFRLADGPTVLESALKTITTPPKESSFNSIRTIQPHLRVDAGNPLGIKLVNGIKAQGPDGITKIADQLSSVQPVTLITNPLALPLILAVSRAAGSYLEDNLNEPKSNEVIQSMSQLTRTITGYLPTLTNIPDWEYAFSRLGTIYFGMLVEPLVKAIEEAQKNSETTTPWERIHQDKARKDFAIASNQTLTDFARRYRKILPQGSYKYTSD